ncbi:MAG TPA: Rieske (2Fe-2S) protein [Sporichthya sp.]|nr:Rieske (2Fe-2S) protein [Sporichthya sp.]
MASSEVSIGKLDQFPDGALTAVEADGKKVIVARTGDQVCAVLNRCPHLGLPLTKGPGGLKYSDGVVQCAWHNSTFQVCSGENLDWVGGFGGKSIPKWSRGMIALGRKAKGLDIIPASVRNGEVVLQMDT